MRDDLECTSFVAWDLLPCSMPCSCPVTNGIWPRDEYEAIIVMMFRNCGFVSLRVSKLRLKFGGLIAYLNQDPLHAWNDDVIWRTASRQLPFSMVYLGLNDSYNTLDKQQSRLQIVKTDIKAKVKEKNAQQIDYCFFLLFFLMRWLLTYCLIINLGTLVNN